MKRNGFEDDPLNLKNRFDYHIILAIIIIIPTNYDWHAIFNEQNICNHVSKNYDKYVIRWAFVSTSQQNFCHNAFPPF